MRGSYTNRWQPLQLHCGNEAFSASQGISTHIQRPKCYTRREFPCVMCRLVTCRSRSPPQPGWRRHMAFYITSRRPKRLRLTIPETQCPAGGRGTASAKCYSLEGLPAGRFRESCTVTFWHDSFRELSYEVKTHFCVHMRKLAGSCVCGLPSGGSAAAVAYARVMHKKGSFPGQSYARKSKLSVSFDI
jgi:hypothetical protein